MNFTDFNYIVETLAADAFEYLIEYSNDVEGDIDEHVFMVVDSSEWTIYHGKACDLVEWLSGANYEVFSSAEDYAKDMGYFESVDSYFEICGVLAFCILAIQVRHVVEQKVKKWKTEEVA